MAISLKIDDELKERVDRLAELRQRSSHWIMREAIAQYVERAEAHESFKQEALAAWTEYQASGHTLSGPAVQAWLSAWGSDTEVVEPA